MFKLIDTHCHLEEIENLEAVIEKAKLVGVIAIVAVGSDYDSNREVLEIAGKYKNFVFPALGLHPGNLAETKIDLTFDQIGVEKAVFHWYSGTSSVRRKIIEGNYFLSANPAAFRFCLLE